MNDFSYWVIFLSAAFLLNISPGTDMLYLISKTMSHGKKTGIVTVFGLGTGAMVHTVFVALGISVIISTSIVAFNILKYIGATYLFYLGIKAIFSGGIKIDKPEKSINNQSGIKAYYQAVLVDVLNPKVAIFFMAFLPQFYRENNLSRIIQFLILGLIIILIGFVVETVIVLASDKISKILRESKYISKILDKILGTVLIGLGIKLAFGKNN